MAPDMRDVIALADQRGTPLQRARARRVLLGEEPDPEAIGQLAGLQNPDGGFPYAMVEGRASSLSKTTMAISWLNDLGLAGGIPARRALEHLTQVQLPDGGWDENAQIAAYDPPPWAAPGNEAARPWLSATAGFWLAALQSPVHPAVAPAGRYLSGLSGPGGWLKGPPHATWIAAAFFLMVEGDSSETGRRCTEALLSRPLERWGDSQLAWALGAMATAGAGPDHPLVQRLLPELRARRKADGTISSEDGADHDLDATVDAARVLCHYGVW